jgi:glyoxalase family protein
LDITGIHHVTMVSADAQRTLDFYADVLGLRLVKRTVNFDDPSAYHLYLGDEEGAPGTLLTFFEWPDADRGRWGVGGTHHIALETRDRDTLRMWKRRLTDLGVPVTGPYDRVYFESIYFTDPDGLIVEIATRGPGWTVDEAPDALGQELRLPPPATTAAGRDEAAIAADTWPEPISAPTPEMRLRGLHHVTAIGSDAERTTAFYADLLGLRLLKQTVNFDDPNAPHLYYGVGAGAPGTIVTFFAYPERRMRRARMGAGQTHHLALAVPDDAAQQAWIERLTQAGVEVTPVRDRSYFKSIYFRDPDGHLLEIATAGPGFAVDEPADRLGGELKLPDWLEPRRTEIAASLRPLRAPGSAAR